MLAPETRALLTDALRPPEGWRIDRAVGTTYSLDLTALLLAPMSFALHDTTKDDLDAVDGIALLEALRRYAGRTTIFCQAGGIHPPAKFSPLMQLLEGSVVQVAPPTAGRIFHPKVWILRFRAADDSVSHRVLVLSRNLTFDRSWDTVLQLDECEGPSTSHPDVTPLVRFLRALPDLATAPVADQQRSDVDDLAATLTSARFELPLDFTSLEFLPLGIGEPPAGLPTDADRALLISPFLDAGSAARWIGSAKRAVVLSRPESFDRIGPKHLDHAHEFWTLQRSAEVEVGDDAEAAHRASSEWASVRDGLHAKTFVFEKGREATVITGSANLTTAAFSGNVEFSVAMSGPAARCGIASIWDGSTESPGLSRLAEPYTPHDLDGDDQTCIDLELAIDQFHRALATQVSTADVHAVGDDTADVALSIAPSAPGSPGETFIWPVSLPKIRARVLAPTLKWPGQARRDITPFFAVETTMQRDGVTVCKRSVVIAELTGDIGDRSSLAMSEILRNANDVLRYLSLLLADPRLDIAAHLLGGKDGAAPGFQPMSGYTDLIVLEPLIRASARDDEAIERVASLLLELRARDDVNGLLPEGFAEIWDAVDQARQVRL